MVQVEIMEQRLTALEREVRNLRDLFASLTTKESEPKSDPELPGAEKAPGIDQLRALLAAHGVYPGNEIIRQEIASMRDQEEEYE